MKTNVSTSQNPRKYYLSEFSLYDGDHFITFNIIDINTDKPETDAAIQEIEKEPATYEGSGSMAIGGEGVIAFEHL